MGLSRRILEDFKDSNLGERVKRKAYKKIIIFILIQQFL